MSGSRVSVYTDGACSHNPGPGGWAAIVCFPDGSERVLTGSHPHTTNNRMELMAPIAALESLDPGAQVHIVTDSQYVQLGITRWIISWKRRGWRTASGGAVKNQPLWERLDRVIALHHVTWEWVKGHAQHAHNERADRLARQAVESTVDATNFS